MTQVPDFTKIAGGGPNRAPRDGGELELQSIAFTLPLTEAFRGTHLA